MSSKTSMKSETSKKRSCRARAEGFVKPTVIVLGCLLVVISLSICIFLLFTRFESKVPEYATNLLTHNKKTESKINMLMEYLYVMLSVCAIAALVGLIGITATACYSYWTLVIFLLLLCILLAAKAGVSVAVAMKIQNVKVWIDDGLSTSMAADRANMSETQRMNIEKLQTELSCCGCPKPGTRSSAMPPTSCGADKTSCCDALWAFITIRLKIATGLTALVMVIEILAFVVALFMLYYTQYQEVQRGRVTFILDKRVEAAAEKAKRAKYAKRLARNA